MSNLDTVAAWFRAKANCYATCAAAMDNVALMKDDEMAKQMLETMYAMWKRMNSDPWPEK